MTHLVYMLILFAWRCWATDGVNANGGPPIAMEIGANINELNPWQSMFPSKNIIAHASPWVARRYHAHVDAFLWAANSLIPGIPVNTEDFVDYPDHLPVGGTFPEDVFVGALYHDMVVLMSSLSIRDASGEAAVTPAYLPGTYILQWDGDGSILLRGDIVANVSTQIHGGRAVVNMQSAGNGLEIILTSSRSANPIRNISLVPAALENWQNSYLPQFVELVKPFKVLRHSGFQRELHGFSPNGMWEKRTSPAAFTQAGPRGVALELAVELCWITNASCWFSVPHVADDVYIQQFANLLLTQLVISPPTGYSGQLYVEFSSGGYTAASADRLAFVADTFQNALQMFADAENASLDTIAAWRSKLRIVAGLPTPYFLPHLLTHLQQLSAGDSHPFAALAKLDAIAVPGHFTESLQWHDPAFDFSSVSQASDASLLSLVRRAVFAADALHNDFATHVHALNMNNTLGKSLMPMIYHGGSYLQAPTYGRRWRLQHLPPSNVTDQDRAAAAEEQAWHDRLNQLSRSPEMYDIHMDFLARCRAAGFGTFVASDLMRPAMANQMWQLRKNGNNALVESWTRVFDAMWPTLRWNESAAAVAAVFNGSVAGVAQLLEAVRAASPKYSAVVDFAAGLSGGFPLSKNSSSETLPELQPCDPPCVWGTCFQQQCHCYADVVGISCDVILPTIAANSSIGCRAPHMGINVAGPVDWATQIMFNNIYKQSRHWIPQMGYSPLVQPPWEVGPMPPLDDNDYPLHLIPGYAVGSMMQRDLQGHYPAGTYTILWDGDGLLAAWMTDVREVRYIDVGVMEVDLVPGTDLNNGLFLRIERTNPQDRVRNIRVLAPGVTDAWAQAFPFNPTFLHVLRNFTTIRAMDLVHTNQQMDMHWEDRTIVEDRTYTIRGVPVEMLVRLANVLKLNLWLNIPHLATDDYVRQYAVLVAETLRPDVQVSIEYSNEVWGTLFPGGQYAQQQGVILNMTRFATSSYTDSNEARFCFYAIRSKQIWDIWEDVYRAKYGVAGRNKLRFIIASQAVNADVSQRLLGCNNTGAAADALAIAPYFASFMTVENSRRDADLLSLDTLFNTSLPAALQGVRSWLVQQRAVADQYGLPLVTYEAGQHLLGDSALQTERAIAANRDPRMGSMYTDYLRLLVEEGVSDILLFTSVSLPSRYGSFGHLEALDSPLHEAYRWKAIMQHTYNISAHDNGQCPSVAQHLGQGCAGTENAATGEPCSGNGWCVGSPYPSSADSRCACFEGFGGTSCNETVYIDVNECSYQCSGHGQCVVYKYERSRRYWRCDCDEGWGGVRCTLPRCESQCSWNGRCIAPDTCACYAGFAGEECQLDCGCGLHGVCAWQRGIVGAPSTTLPVTAMPPSCACDAGYTFNATGGFVRAPTSHAYAFANANSSSTIHAGFLPRSSGVANVSEMDSGSLFVSDDALGTYFAAGKCIPRCEMGCAAGSQCIRPNVCSCPACIHGTCMAGRCVCWAGYGGADCSRRLRPLQAIRAGGLNAAFSPVGLNLVGISYWSSDMPFIDLFKMSSEWIPQHVEAHRPTGVYVWNLGDTVPLNVSDEYEDGGWPLQQRDVSIGAGKLISRDNEHAWPDGRYVLRYDGSGDVVVGFDATMVSERKGRIELDVRFSKVRDNGIYIRVEGVDAANPIRNIRLVLAENEDLLDDGVEFNPLFLQSLRSYSTLRFMDWQATNEAHNRQRRWTDRPTRRLHTYALKGVPLETMVHLANILAVSPWFNIHHLADEDYIRHFATYVRNHLRFDLPVYLERSNEVWNVLFPAGAENYATATALNLHAAQLHAQRSVNMINLWKDVWGEVERRKRLVHVLSTQTANSWITQTMLAFNGTFQHVDAVGVTAYIDCGGLGLPRNSQRTALMTVEQILDVCDAVRPAIMRMWQDQIGAIESVLADNGVVQPSPSVTPSVLPSLAPRDESNNATGLDGFEPIFWFDVDSNEPIKPNMAGIPLIVYEGGPGLVEQEILESEYGKETPGLKELFWAANRHPRMESTYRAYLDGFAELGLARGRRDTFPYIHFSSVARQSKYGSFGLLEHYRQTVADSPKARALHSFIADVVTNLTRPGCRNPAATNFDPRARYEDNSCVFPPVQVSTAGGVVMPPGAPVQLTVPAGAVTSAVGISVAVVPDAPALVSANGTELLVATPVLDLGPDGTQFSVPLSACVTINMTEVAEFGWGVDGEDDVRSGDANVTLHLYHSSDGIVWKASENSVFNPATGELCGDMWHFTLAAGMRVPAAELAQHVESSVQERLQSQPPQHTADDNSTLPLGGIIGIAVGGAALLALVVSLIAWRIHTARRARSSTQAANPKATDFTTTATTTSASAAKAEQDSGAGGSFTAVAIKPKGATPVATVV